MTEVRWESYEQVAAFLLNKFAEHFQVGRFEGKQIVPGESGTSWEIDARGCSDGSEIFLVVECKRYTKARVNQAIAGSLAWAIRDTGASGGILVSPMGLQAGAKLVAASAGVIEVILDEHSSTTQYFMSFLGKICLGFAETIGLSENVQIVLKDEDGNIIESRAT